MISRVFPYTVVGKSFEEYSLSSSHTLVDADLAVTLDSYSGTKN